MSAEKGHSVKLAVNGEATDWNRSYLRDHPDELRALASRLPSRLTGRRCVCCPGEPEGECPEGHALCAHCAESHGCMACSVIA